ncbi:MAG TPA: hypothetical protein VKJ65_01210 [Phycisphaerae bacterium]|nr:hypothetical protein [Phycisphaerae bacterium]
MLSPKINRLLNGAVDQALSKTGSYIGKEVQTLKCDLVRKGLRLSSVAEQRLTQVNIEIMQKNCQ